MALNNLLSFVNIIKSIGGILLAVVILLVMVTIHELGHYIAGKILKFKITEFSIGFGPALFKKRSKKTGELFAVRLVPLGGYCAFDGEDEFEEKKTEEPFEETTPTVQEQHTDGVEDTDEYPEPVGARFNDQAPWKRIIVLLAGVTMNYILSMLLIITMFAGFGRTVYRIQVEKPEENQTQTLIAESGLQTGDIVLSVDGETPYLITDYVDILNGKKAGDTLTFTVLADGETIERKVTLLEDASFVNMSDTQTLLKTLGIYGMYSETHKEGFFQTIGSSFVYSFKIGGTLLRSLGELLTGKMGLEAMGGPVTTIKVTSQVASTSFASFLNIFAFIGVNLAVFNLLPVPALDGCKVIFCIIEWIRKKPINRKVETIINLAGLLFLFGFAILVDVLQFVL